MQTRELRVVVKGLAVTVGVLAIGVIVLGLEVRAVIETPMYWGLAPGVLGVIAAVLLWNEVG